MENRPKIKIALVEDHGVVRNAISKMLAEIPAFQFVFDAANGQEFIDKLKDNPIDLVLLDLEMPVLNGIEVLKELKRIESTVKVIILTMHDDQEIVFELLSKGADAYLLKECSTREMVDAITNVYNSLDYSNPVMNSAILNAVAYERKTQSRMKHLDLTERDLKVLRLICDGKKGQEIADSVFTSKKNLDLIRTNLMKKFKVTSANELIRLCIIHGLYKPRSNEQIEKEKEDILAAKKLKQIDGLLGSFE
jgi:two-component system, NarL family, response regulator DegU